MAYKGSPILVDGGQNRRRLIRLGVMLAILIGVMIALGDLATRLQKKIEYDYLEVQAGILEYDSGRVYLFAETEIAQAEYQGSLRGPLGTLWEGVGSELDKAQLLVTMLHKCGVEAQLARSGDRWWVDSPAVHVPDGVGEVEWRGTMIPSSASHRLEVEIRAGDDHEPLRLLWNFADINNDPILLDWENGSIHVRRASQRKAAGSMLLPADCIRLEIVCRHLRPNDEVALQTSQTLGLNRQQLMLAPDELEDAGLPLGVLIVLLGTPPDREEVHKSYLSGRLLTGHVSRAYQDAVQDRRLAERDISPSIFDQDVLVSPQLPSLYLAAIPPEEVWKADPWAIEAIPFH
jgi:hypothetical protein